MNQLRENQLKEQLTLEQENSFKGSRLGYVIMHKSEKESCARMRKPPARQAYVFLYIQCQ